jgi:DNA polymerase-3 subunit epsilon
VDQIDWRGKGHGTKSLEYLCKDHGFFFKGHTALADVEAALNLVSQIDPDTGKPYLDELLKNARTLCKWVIAKNSRYEIKDELKNRGYRWDAKQKVWKIKVPLESREEEEFLSDHPLGGNPVTKEIPLEDNFK